MRSASTARPLIVLALITILLTNSIAFSAYAAGRPATAPTLAPDPPSNGLIAFARVDTDYTVNGIYLINPDGSGEGRIPFTEFDSTPVWSPNGLRLAVVHLANQHSGDVSGFGVEIMNADGSGRVRLNDNMEPGERIAWSPDGTKIAFTSWSNFSPNADIMIMDADSGSNIVNLTNDPSYDYLPSWSPDGTKIIFTSNRSGNLDLFVMNADGSNQQNITNYYANDYYPSWSPDGSKIVFVSSGRGGTFDNDEICVMNADGSNVINLTVNQVNDLMPAWSPDGTQIIFNSDRNSNRDLYSMNADGSNQTRVTIHPAQDSRASWQLTPVSTPTPTPTPTPAPTPPLNGNIAFTHFDFPNVEKIATINEDGSNLTVLTSGSHAEDPEVSPDGTRIAFSSVSSGQFHIWLMNADGSGLTRLTYNDQRGGSEPTWSPDGSKIAFVGGSEIWVINADGTNEVNLSGGRTGDNYPDWSPDGSKIVFTKDYSSPNAETFVMNADGSNLVNLSNTVTYGAERDPAWSPDGSKIAYQSFQDGHYEIYVMNADGSGETRITNTVYPVANEHPDWSPDGSKIVFSSTRDNNNQEIYVMNADGAGQTRLTNDPAEDTHPSWGSYVAAPPTPTPTPAQADLAATADAQPYQVEPGGALVFNNAVTNNGPSLANNVSVDVYVPPGTQLDSYTAPGGTCQTTTYPNDAGHQVLCSFGDVGPSETRSVTVNVTITAIDGASMQAINTVSSSTGDPDSNNDVAYAPLIVRAATPPAADLAATAGLNLLAANGATVTHNVSASNYGTDAAEYVTLTIQLPPGATYDTATNPYGSCTPRAPDAQGTIVDCTVGDIPAYESRLISHTAMVTGAPYEVLTFTSTVGSDTSDPYLDSNVSSVSVQIEGPPVPTPTTADNRLIAFETRRDGNSEIYSRRADGSAQSNLTNDSADDDGFVWSPDGSKLAFSRLVDAGSNNRELFVMDADGSNVAQLTSSPDYSDGGPVWSPDGTKLLFTSMSNQSQTRALWVTNADGTNQIQIGISPYDYDTDPTWSPDGSKIAYARDYFDGVNPTERNIYTANADGSNRTRIGHIVGANDTSPAWSADGTKINFVRDVGGVVDIYDMDLDGSNQRNLSNLGNAYAYPAPVRSADRSKIAFVTGITGPIVYTMNADGSSLVGVLVAGSHNVSTLSWSPDATKLAIGTIFNVGLGAGIHVANTDGSGSLHFGGDAEYNQDPDWSPDGSRIAFTTRRTGNGGIDIINADGTGRVDLTNDPAYYRHPKWQPIPPSPPIADVYITAYATGLYVPNGGQVTYNIVVGSFGPYPVSNIALTGQFPAGVTFVSADTAGGSCTGTPGDSTFNCTITDTINSYESRQVTVTATATGVPYTPIDTTFGVTSAYDNNSDNNSAVAQFYIASPPLPGPTPGPVNEAQLAYGEFDSNVGQWDIFVQRADAAGLVNLTNSPTTEDKYAWSPDGSRLGFLRFDFANTTVSLCTVNADGSNLAVLTNVPNEYIDSFAWSPDSNRLTFNVRAWISEGPQTSEIFVINADGTGRASVSGPAGYNNEPEWSPAGTRISYLRYFFDPDAPTSDIYVSNPDGTNQIIIANGPIDYDSDVDWSPDGARLAFTRSDLNGIAHIFTVRGDGTDIQQLTNDPANTQTLAAHWSPDGSKITFATYSLSGSAHEVMNADGTGRLVVFNPPANGYPSGNAKEWSPDGTRLAFDWAIGEGVGGNTCIVNVDGTGLHCVGNELDTNTAPDWSPDGTRLAFLSRRNGEQSIDIINADGTGRVELRQGNVMSPKWRPMPQGNTPAGTNVAVAANGATVTFSNVTTAGQTTITPIDPNSLSGVPGEYVINANSLAFEITTTAVYSGPITIGFQVPGVNNPITFSTLRVLHGEPPPVPNFVDRTILAPDSPTHDFPARTIYARVTSLSPFVIAEKPPNQLTALGPAQVWIGLKNSDDVGTRFDLLAEVFKNGTLIGSGQVNNVAGGSSGFNNAKLNAINLALSGTPSFGAGSSLSIRLSVRVTATGGHRSGTARLWFNDAAANSRFSATIGGVTKNYYLRKLNNSLVLTNTTASTPKVTIDVFVDRAVGGNPFKPFGTWAITF